MVLLVIIGLVAALAPLVRVDVRAAGQEEDGLRVRCLARAGVMVALATLQQDDATVDGLQDDWVTLGQQGQTVYPLGDGQFRLEVVDASSRLDLNQADRQTLLRLPGIDETIVEEILAWRGAGGGNSSANYESLPRPYQLKAAPFDSVEELLLVQGVTPSLLYGTQEATTGEEQLPWVDLLAIDTASPNQSADGRNRVDLNAASANQLAAASGGALSPPQAQAIVQFRSRSGRFTSLAGLLSVPGLGQNVVRRLVDHVTVTPGNELRGRLNLNTASVQALETLPNVTEEMAQQIVERRESEGDFQTLGDLLDSGTAEFRALVDRATTKSSVFLVRAKGELPNGATRAAEAWVQREGSQVHVVRWRDVPRWPGWAGWGWNEEMTGVVSSSTPGVSQQTRPQ
jgi:competence ComEA-like helix-hairpin-helix protein